MDLIDRYIYAVTRLQPEKQRDDIEKELRSLIDDMLTERAGEAQVSDKDIEAVLKELGEPSALAAKYSGKPRYLIGPELFDTYIKMLKIIPAAAAFGIFIALTVNYAITPPENIGETIGNILGTIFSTVMEVFGWVTLIFALIERHAPDKGKERLMRKEWNPANLPEIPVKGAMIKCSEPIVSIVFIIIFGILLNFAPGIFFIYSPIRGISNTTLFNLDVLRSYLPLIDIAFAASIIKEIFKLVYGRYNLRLAVSTIIFSGISFILTVIVFSHKAIWNLDFVSSMQKIFNTTLPAGYDASNVVMIFTNVILGIIIFSFLMETLKTIGKTIKFGVPDIKDFFNR